MLVEDIFNLKHVHAELNSSFVGEWTGRYGNIGPVSSALLRVLETVPGTQRGAIFQMALDKENTLS